MRSDMVAGRPVSATLWEQCLAGDWLRNCDTPPGSGDWTSELLCSRVESGTSVGIAALLCASTAQRPQWAPWCLLQGCWPQCSLPLALVTLVTPPPGPVTLQTSTRTQVSCAAGVAPHIPTISALQALEGGVGCLRLGNRRELSASALGPGMPLIWVGLSLSFGHSVSLRMFCFYSEIKVFPFQHILPLHVPLNGFSLWLL